MAFYKIDHKFDSLARPKPPTPDSGDVSTQGCRPDNMFMLVTHQPTGREEGRGEGGGGRKGGGREEGRGRKEGRGEGGGRELRGSQC